MPMPYSRQNLGEASYTPAPHDLIVDRYVDLNPPHVGPDYPQPGDGPKPVGV
jgi:hypothetical protein